VLTSIIRRRSRTWVLEVSSLNRCVLAGISKHLRKPKPKSHLYGAILRASEEHFPRDRVGQAEDITDIMQAVKRSHLGEGTQEPNLHCGIYAGREKQLFVLRDEEGEDALIVCFDSEELFVVL
jgi:hypothetical protein